VLIVIVIALSIGVANKNQTIEDLQVSVNRLEASSERSIVAANRAEVAAEQASDDLTEAIERFSQSPSDPGRVQEVFDSAILAAHILCDVYPVTCAAHGGLPVSSQ
jgi:hypothetical protein